MSKRPARSTTKEVSPKRPSLSWIPVRLFQAVLVEKTVTVEQRLQQAADLGLPAVEIYAPFLNNNGRWSVEAVRDLLSRLGLRVSMVTTSPDLTHPDPEIRMREIAATERAVQNAAALQATAVRCTTGQAHPGLGESEGLELVSGALARLAEYARSLRIKIAVENHFRDRMVAELPDFAQRKDTFLKLVQMLRDTPVMVNLDCSNPLMVGESAMDILPAVRDRLVSVHASDRKRGAYVHSPIGEGDADYPAIFQALASSGYDGWISIEDGQPFGDEGFERSLSFVRRSIDEYWGKPS